jgi:methyltransferase (TIGR00027 family)
MSGIYKWGCTACFLIAACLSTAPGLTPAISAGLGDIPVTAEFAAGMRAIAAMDPDEKIRNPDGMAKQFLSPAFWFWSAIDEDYDKSQKFIKYYRVSSYYTFNACTKHIDGILQTAAGNGLEQVVIIGAGLDSRAYRFQQQMPDVRFFEVDLPATVARKVALVLAATGKIPATVAYVPVDYRNAGVDGALEPAGYDWKRKTLFVCEGVTRYIEAAAVDRLMRFIAGNSAPGSELVFDYIPDDIARGDFSKMPWARFQAVRMAAYGHPWKFGIARDKAGEFLTSRGFEVISDLGSAELAQRYLVRSDGSIDGQPTRYVRIVHAAVRK